MSCPSCSADVEVPIPPEHALKSVIPTISFPLPGETIEAYATDLSKIMRKVKFVIVLCDYCKHPELSRGTIDDAIHALGSLNAFVTHAFEAETGRDRRRSTPLTEGLANIAADSNFAGTGTMKAKQNQYERWDDGIDPAQFVSPDSDLLRLIQDSIVQLSSSFAVMRRVR